MVGQVVIQFSVEVGATNIVVKILLSLILLVRLITGHLANVTLLITCHLCAPVPKIINNALTLI